MSIVMRRDEYRDETTTLKGRRVDDDKLQEVSGTLEGFSHLQVIILLYYST